jgi:hypothetical protein
MEADVKLKNTDLQDMEVEWLPSSVLFADTTKVGQE